MAADRMRNPHIKAGMRAEQRTVIKPYTRHENRISSHLPKILQKEILFFDRRLPHCLTIFALLLLLLEFFTVPCKCPLIVTVISAHDRVVIQRIAVLIEEKLSRIFSAQLVCKEGNFIVIGPILIIFKGVGRNLCLSACVFITIECICFIILRNAVLI